MLTSSSPKLPLDQGDEAPFYSRVIGVFSSLAKVLCCNQRKVLENGFPTSRPEDLRYYWRTKDQISRKIFCNKEWLSRFYVALKFGQGPVKHTKMPPVRSSNLDSGLNRTKVACPQFFECRSRFSCGVPIVGSAGVCLIIAEKTQGIGRQRPLWSLSCLSIITAHYWLIIV